MITINLLPEAYRTPQTASIRQIYRSPLLILVAALLVGAIAILGTITQWRYRELQQLKSQLDGLQAQKREIDAVKMAVQALRGQHAAFAGLSTQRSQWAKHLGLLPEVTPEGVWFTDLSFDTKKGLVLQGAAISQGGDEMLRIGRLAQDLKNDPVFSALVKDIQIESMQRQQEGEIEVIHFTLNGSAAGISPEKPS